MSNTNRPSSQTKPTMIGTSRKFSHKPAFAICGRRTSPLPNTMTFGGVPIGNRQEQFAANAAGMANSNGFCPALGPSKSTAAPDPWAIRRSILRVRAQPDKPLAHARRYGNAGPKLVGGKAPTEYQ